MIIIKDDSKEQMRSSMHDEMRRGRGGNYRSSGNRHIEEAYREGYRHGWEDSEDEMNEEHYRRSRDSRGRFV